MYKEMIKTSATNDSKIWSYQLERAAAETE